MKFHTTNSDILKQYQNEVNELHAERLARNANPLALVATAQANQDPYYQTSRSHKSHTPSSKPSIQTRSHTTTRYKGKEIAKPITPPSETASEEDSDPEQARRDKDMQKNLALIAKENVESLVVQQSGIQCFNCKEFRHFAKECRKPKRVKDSAYHKEKMLLCKQAEQGVPLQAEQYDWLADTDEEVDKHELEAHYSYMVKIQEVSIADSGINSEPVKQVQNDAGYNVFANELQHSEQSESVSNTCLVETDDSNVIPDSPNICEDDIQNDQNDVKSDDERVVLANLIANLKLDVDENKKIQKQLKKANTTLAQELKECKTILAETSKGKYMDTKFDKSSVVRQPNAQRIPKPSVLGKPTPFSNSLERMYFPKTKSVPKTNVSEGLSKPVTTLTLPQTVGKAVSNTNVLKPGMYRIDNMSTQTREPQLPQIVKNTNPRISTSTGVITNLMLADHSLRAINREIRSCQTIVKTLNTDAVCATCNKCLVDSNHFSCVMKMLNDVNAKTKKPKVVPISTRKPKSQANKSIVTPHKKKVASKSTKQKPQSHYRMLSRTTRKTWKWWIEQQCPSGYTWVPKTKMQWVPKVRNDHMQKRHMTGNLKLLCNFVEKFLGLNHNLFSVGQFCDADLEVAFRKSTCYVRDLQGNDLLTSNHGSDHFTISLQESTSSTPLCLMAKASPTQAWLWNQRLSQLNFDYINLLSKKDIVIGLPKLKYIKDQLCSSCELSKAKRSSFKSKAVPSSKGRLNLLHLDLCGPMRVASINGKKGTEFLNKTLNAFFKEEGIEHQTSTARTPKQNGVVERRNHTLVEAAPTMLSALQLPLFFWAEAIATACYT
nr:hypothetical protein [Tanacetum cinerariifolium]